MKKMKIVQGLWCWSCMPDTYYKSVFLLQKYGSMIFPLIKNFGIIKVAFHVVPKGANILHFICDEMATERLTRQFIKVV